MSKILFPFLFLMSLALATHAQSITTKQKDIRQLMDLMGTTSLMKQSMSRSMEQLKKLNASLPEEFWTGVAKEANYEDLIELLIPVYDKHYTEDEINGLLAFYKSPLGQKSIRELPAIMQESSAIGKTWGEQLGRRVMEQIQQQQAKSKN